MSYVYEIVADVDPAMGSNTEYTSPHKFFKGSEFYLACKRVNDSFSIFLHCVLPSYIKGVKVNGHFGVLDKLSRFYYKRELTCSFEKSIGFGYNGFKTCRELNRYAVNGKYRFAFRFASVAPVEPLENVVFSMFTSVMGTSGRELMDARATIEMLAGRIAAFENDEEKASASVDGLLVQIESLNESVAALKGRLEEREKEAEARESTSAKRLFLEYLKAADSTEKRKEILDGLEGEDDMSEEEATKIVGSLNGLIKYVLERPVQGNNCSICREAKKDCLFMPCFHISTCESCGSKVDRCCMCRQPIESRKKVYV